MRTVTLGWGKIKGGSCRPHIKGPDETIGISPFRFALDDVSDATNGNLIAGHRNREFAHPNFKYRSLRMNTRIAKLHNRVRSFANDADKDIRPALRREHSVLSQTGEHCINRQRDAIHDCGP